jgi:hypothetical protein
MLNMFAVSTYLATVTKNRTYGKLQVFGNNSKTVNNIKNLTWGINDQHIKIYLPCNFEVNLISWCTASPDTILKLDTLVMIQTKFGFHWSSTFRGEDF